MKLISVNVGRPRLVDYHGVRLSTGIFKEPIAGRVMARKLDLDGDRQADLTVHGGELKAVYCYPVEHYEYWKRELPGRDLPYGSFGENFTTEGLLENEIHVGDQFSVGSALFAISQPRLPCFKLGIRFDDPLMVKRFLESGRSGFYLAVLREGEVGAGDAISITARDANAVSIAEINRLFVAKRLSATDRPVIERALNVPILPEMWRDHFSQQLQFLDTEHVG
jgi:MOSC domain-containing protein YiiM